MTKIKAVLLVLGCLAAQSRARASEMGRLRAMAQDGAAVQAEAFTNGGARGQAAVPGAQAKNPSAPLKAFQPRLSKGASPKVRATAAGKIRACAALGGFGLLLGAAIAAIIMDSYVGVPLVVFLIGCALFAGAALTAPRKIKEEQK